MRPLPGLGAAGAAVGAGLGRVHNADSRNDGRVTFEQDRCPAFVDGGDRWTRPVRETPPVG